jgi:O-antigen ligase
VSLRSIHRAILFLVGVSILTGGVAIVPGLLGLSKPVTALLAVSVCAQILTGSQALSLGRKDLWVLLFSLAVGIGFATSISQRLPAQFINFILVSYSLLIIFYFLLSASTQSTRDARAFLWGLLIGGTTASATVLLGYDVGAGDLTVDDRTGGLSGDPNYFAMGAVTAVMAAVYLVLHHRSWLIRAVITGCAIVMVSALFASLSRGGYLALAATVLFFMARYALWGRLRIVIPALLVALSIPFVLPARVRDRVMTLTATNRQLDVSIQSRLMQYRRGMDLFTSSPVIGVGLGRSNVSEVFGGAVDRRDLGSISGSTGRHHVLHNSFLIIAAEMGLVGLLPYVMLIALSWFEFGRVVRLRPESRSTTIDPELRECVEMAAVLQAAFLGLVVAGMFLNAARFKATWAMFALSVALLRIATVRLKLSENHAIEAPHQPDSAWGRAAKARAQHSLAGDITSSQG